MLHDIRTAVRTSTCTRCGQQLWLVPWGLHYKWVGSSLRWKCQPTAEFPVRSHVPAEPAVSGTNSEGEQMSYTAARDELIVLNAQWRERHGADYYLYTSRPGDGQTRCVFTDGVVNGYKAALARMKDKIAGEKDRPAHRPDEKLHDTGWCYCGDTHTAAAAHQINDAIRGAAARAGLPAPPYGTR